MIEQISDFAPEDAEVGVGLALQNNEGRYIFALGGSRYRSVSNEILCAGIGGHKEHGESWLDTAYREVREEIGGEVSIVSSNETWIIKSSGEIDTLVLNDEPTPIILYEMVHPAGTPRAGQIYRIVIYRAQLIGSPGDLQCHEVHGVIALSRKQVHEELQTKPTLVELLNGGGELIAGGEGLSGQTRLDPIGTARALGELFRYMAKDRL